MPTEAQLVDALTRADAAGDTRSARQFAGMIRQMRQGSGSSKYQVTAPDGTKYEITAPAGATQDQVLAYAKQQHGQTSQQNGVSGADLSQVPTAELIGMLRQHAQSGTPIVAQSADGVHHQFPAGTSMSVIDRAMKNYAQSKSPPNPAMDALRVIPGGLAQGAAMVAGLPGDLSDLANRGMDYLTGGDVAKRHPALVTSQNVSKLLSAPTGGYYQPQTTAGNYAETIASFVPAALGGGPTSIAARVARVVVPAVASETGGQLTKGTPAEPYARLLFAGAGGVGPSIARYGARAVNAGTTALTGKSFLNPAREAQARVAAAMAKDGQQQNVAQNTARYLAAGASPPAVIDVGGNNVKRLVRAAAGADGPGQNLAIEYGDTIRGNYADRLLGHTRALTPDTRTAEQLAADLKQQQRSQAQTLYAKPYSEPVTMTPEALRALRGPDGQMAIDRAIRGARANQRMDQVNELVGLKTADFDRPPVVSAASLDRVRIAMGERSELAARNGAKDVSAGLLARKAALDTALDATPGLKTARSAYRQNQAQREAVDLGLGAYNAPSGIYTSKLLRAVSIAPEARQAAGVGYRQSLTNSLERSPEGATGVANRIATSQQQGKNLATTFGDAPAQRYQNALRLETERVRNANFISPNTGSQTEPRLADAGLLHIPASKHGLIQLVVNKLRAGLTVTPAERAEIVRLGISPAQIMALVKRREPLLRRAVRSGATYGAVSQAAANR
jgi:hypothetical protein